MSDRVGRVLVVDDDAVILALCQRTLRQAGFIVHAVSSADSVLMILQNQPFELVLLDLHMPTIDGLTMLDQIRSHNLDMPIIIITGTATVEHAAQAIRLGAQGLLLKPFSPADLRQTALDVLQKRREVRTHDRVAALRPLVQTSQGLLAELDLPRFYDQIIETVRVELGADRASLMLCEDNERLLRIAACSGLPKHVQVGQQVELAGSLAGWVAMHRQPLLIDNRREPSPYPLELQHLLVKDQIVSAVSVPLLTGKQVLGVLNAAKTHAGPSFTEADQELLVLLASQAAIALENARLYSTVAHSEARYRALLHHATDAVLLLDAQGTSIIDANPAVEQLSGYGHDQLLETPPASLLPQLADLTNGNGKSGSHEPKTISPLPMLPNGTPNPDGSGEVETLLHTRGGHSLPVSVSISHVPYDGQDLLLLIMRDISERQRLAQQLFQTEKLAAVGRLSASIAHEINNPLQAIHNSLHLLINRPLNDEKRERYLVMAQDEVERLISIVQRMLDFYRPSREGMRPTDLHDLLEAVLSLTGKQLDTSHVRVVLDLYPRLPLVFAIGNHIKQVYLNLIFNAIEAMSDGGTLSVRTFLMDESDNQPEAGFTSISTTGAAGHPIRGRSVVVEFSDTGQGIPPQDLTKIFEPFYTTRTKGTGLGLAVSYSIIEQHHGELSVSSTMGEGTTFRIRLPIAT